MHYLISSAQLPCSMKPIRFPFGTPELRELQRAAMHPCASAHLNKLSYVQSMLSYTRGHVCSLTVSRSFWVMWFTVPTLQICCMWCGQPVPFPADRLASVFLYADILHPSNANKESWLSTHPCSSDFPPEWENPGIFFSSPLSSLLPTDAPSLMTLTSHI